MQLKVDRWEENLSGGKDHLKIIFRGIFPSNLCALDGFFVVELEGRVKQK